MEIILTGNSEIIDSISVRSGKLGLDLMFNTGNRWVQYGCRGGWCSGITAENVEKIGKREILCFEFSEGEGHHEKVCGVILISETEEDAQLLNGLRYDQQENEQINYLILKPDYVTEGFSRIAEYKSEIDNTQPVKTSLLNKLKEMFTPNLSLN